MKKTNLFFAILTTLTLFSFAYRYGMEWFGDRSAYPGTVEEVLEMSGENRAELERVIANYSAQEDSLKLRALWFLLEHMPGKYSAVNKGSVTVDRFISGVHQFRESEDFLSPAGHHENLARVHDLWDEVRLASGGFSKTAFSVEPDLLNIKADVLIENIDYAFKVWELPWCSHLDFEAFCEYILPYRLKDERLEPWRRAVYERYLPLMDSLTSAGMSDPVEVGRLLNEKTGSGWMYSDKIGTYPVALTANELWKGKAGNCTQQTQLGVLVMRALGIPAVYEQIPHFGNRSLGHDYVSIIDKNGEPVDLDYGDLFGGPVSYRIWLGVKIPKIYRYMYSGTGGNAPDATGSNFRFAKKDVTAEYVLVGDVSLKLGSPPRGTRNVYLCVFDNREWRPVAVSDVSRGLASFTDMGSGILYMPMYFENGILVPAGDPLVLDTQGKTHTLNPEVGESIMLLKRKYFKTSVFKQMSAIRGKFQGANRPDFRDAVDLYTITDSLDLVPQSIGLEGQQSFRYIRYLFSDRSNGHLAELKVFGKEGDMLDGEIITDGRLKDEATVKNAFNALQFYVNIDIEGEDLWYGLDLGQKVKVSNVSFCPGTDKNDVWPGLRYELFYWDDQWVSLGKKRAKSNELTYASPVYGGLFLLRCLDEGKEERIFTYENEKQVWW